MTTAAKLPFQCKFTIPGSSAPVHDVISRWSDTKVEKPTIVVVPDSEHDIIQAVRYAQENGLRVLPAGGGHGSYVPVTPDTLYLDMSSFDKTSLNEEEQTVTVQGGVITRDFIKSCLDKGYYSCWPNSNAVGVVGFAIGLGNHAFRGFNGVACDFIVSCRIVTASGKLLELSSASTGDELQLFSAICGAGHGFGVITSLTLKAFPVADLNLQGGDRIWVRRLIFPGSQIAAVASVFASLPEPSPETMAIAVFARSPPGSPAPGSPIIIVTFSYFGPAENGEKAAKILFDEQLTSKAIKSETDSTPLSQMNLANEPFNTHGGYKGIHTAWVKRISPEMIQSAYQQWHTLTSSDDVSNSVLILQRSNTEKTIALGESSQGKATYFQGRDEGVAIVTTTFATKLESTGTLAAYVKELFDLCGYEEKPLALTSGVLKDPLMRGQLKPIRRADQLAQLKSLKETWDPSGLFWSPYFT